MRGIILGIGLMLLVTALFAGGSGERSNEHLLVDTGWLENNLNKVTVIDYGRSYEDFTEGHIPGAVYLDRSLFWAEVDGVPGMLPDPEDIGAELGARGISNKGTIVVYDGGNSLWAARAFWAFEILGHRDVRLLDRGLTDWRENAQELSTTEEGRTAVNFQVRYQPQLLVQKSEILEKYDNDDFVVLDTRSAGEYDGTDIRANRGGHIPNAVNIDWVENLGDEGAFKPLAELASFYDSSINKNDRVAAHCQTGVRGAHSYFTLRFLGYKDVAVYDGSWAEWGNLDDTPISLQ